MSKQIRKTCLEGCVLIFAVLCCLCYFSIYALEGADQVFSTPLKKWRAERWLRSTYADISDITADVLLSEEEPQTGEGGTMRCVRGWASRTLGADRPYAEVVEDYVSWLTERGWREGESPYFKDIITHYFYIPDNTYRRSFAIAPRESEEPIHYETVYIIGLEFEEYRCMGG